jgi:dUTP pyrophosphatase
LSEVEIIATQQPCTRATERSFGYDLRTNREVRIVPNETAIIGTGVFVKMSSLVMGMVCSRSGLSTKGIVVANAPGIIDSDYEDEIKVILHNHGKESYVFQAGDKIAQLVFTYGALSSDVVSEKRHGGLGSTGT